MYDDEKLLYDQASKNINIFYKIFNKLNVFYKENHR